MATTLMVCDHAVMLPVVTAVQMREFDRQTIEEIGLPGVVLMENAGRRIAEVAANYLDGLRDGSVAVVCGGGNNGGDGFVCARVLREQGFPVRIYLAVDESSVRGDAATHYRAYCETGGKTTGVKDTAAVDAATPDLSRVTIIVDALFGTGLTRSLEGHWLALVAAINQSQAWVVAADVPSGIDSDSGHPLGAAVRADHTVSMAFAKLGIVSEPGFEYTGTLEVAEIGIPKELACSISVEILEDLDVAARLPPLSPCDYKNRRGHVLVVGGSPGMVGAGRLASRAAQRAGAGLVTWAPLGQGMNTDAPDSIMVAMLADDPDQAVKEMKGWLTRVDVVVVGPGLAGDLTTRSVLEALLASELPLVVDAGALTCIGTELKQLKRGPKTVITPHPKEAARLLGVSSAEVCRNRIEIARRLTVYGTICVLKGARTIIDDGSHMWLNPTGNPGMATAGAGDVLAGIIAALIGQGSPVAEAAAVGAYIHGSAGDRAALRMSPWAMNSEDMINALPEVYKALSGLR